MARLEVRTGRHEGKGYDLTKAVILGRGETAGIQLPDGKASREHCRVFQQGGSWIVADLNSVNGITVNKAKTTRKNLRNGDRIEVGETVVEFVDAETVTPQTGAPLSEPGEIDVDEIDIDDEPDSAARPAAAQRKGGSKKDAAFAKARSDAAAAKQRASAARARGGGGKSGGVMQVKDDVLQFNKIDSRGSSPFSLDLSQYSAMAQMAIMAAAVGFLCLVAWGIAKGLEALG